MLIWGRFKKKKNISLLTNPHQSYCNYCLLIMEKYCLSFYSPINSLVKKYQLAKLPNGILVLLISDPSEKSASCSLTVATGSFNDPQNIPGLAHLCEHMILAGGSKKYPSTTQFRDELTKNSGKRNAYTTGQETTFYFYIPNSNMLRKEKNYNEQPPFEVLLDIFGSCFENPLFKKNELNNEIIAIDNEHSGNKANKKKVMYHGGRILSNQQHPFSNFSTGNLHTLKTVVAAENINIIVELENLVDNYFFGNNMTLCLKSSDSLNVLLRLAKNTFGNIKADPISKSDLLQKFKFYGTGNLNDPKLEKSLNSLNSSVLKTSWDNKIGNINLFPDSNDNIIFIKNDTSNNLIRVLMPVFHNDLLKFFSKKEIAKLCYCWIEILGEESENSFDNYLKANGFIISSLAYMSENAINNDALILELRLTNKGWSNLDVILINLKNNYLSFLLSEASIKPLAKAFSEHNSLDILKFLYQDVTQNSIEECSKFSSNVLTKCFTDFIEEEYLLKAIPFIFYNGASYGESSEGKNYWLKFAKLWQTFLKIVSNEQSLKFIIYGDPKTVNLNEFLNIQLKDYKNYTIDTYYGLSYYKTKLKIESKFDSAFNFEIPSSNKFVPSIIKNNNKTVLHALEASKKNNSNKYNMGMVLNNSMIHTQIKLLSKNKKHQLLVKDETHNIIFKSKSILSINIINDKILPSPLNSMLLEVLTEVIAIKISSVLYPAIKVGYFLTVSPSLRGDINLKLSISGFTDGILTILDTVINCIKDISINCIKEDILQKAKINVKKKFETAANENGFKLSLIGLYIVLEKYVWNLENRFEALDNKININSFKNFVGSFVLNLKVSMFHQGDLGNKSTELLNHCLSNIISGHLDEKLKNTLFTNDYYPDTCLLPIGANYIVKGDSPNNDPNNSICYYLQIGEFGKDKKDFLGLTTNKLFNLTKLADFIFELHLVPDLRVKRHLGYIVVGGARTLTRSFGLQISTMSSLTTTEMETKINDYLYDFECSLVSSLTEQSFKINYVDELLKVLNSNSEFGQSSEQNSLPSDILQSVPANFTMSGNTLLQSQYNLHRKLFESINLKRYNSNSLTCEDKLDLTFISSITLQTFLSFYKYYISIKSENRSKLSIHISTQLSKDEITKKMIYMQIEYFLKIKNFNFDAEKIKEIVYKNEHNTTGMLKDLYSYFSRQGDSMKFMLTGFKELFRSVTGNLTQSSYKLSTTIPKNNANTINVTTQNKNLNKSSNIKTVVITDSNYFRNKDQKIVNTS